MILLLTLAAGHLVMVTTPQVAGAKLLADQVRYTGLADCLAVLIHHHHLELKLVLLAVFLIP